MNGPDIVRQRLSQQHLAKPIAGTPAEIVGKLNREIVRILAEPKVAQYFASQGAEPSGTTPAGLAQYMRDEHARWKRVIKAANIQAE